MPTPADRSKKGLAGNVTKARPRFRSGFKVVPRRSFGEAIARTRHGVILDAKATCVRETRSLMYSGGLRNKEAPPEKRRKTRRGQFAARVGLATLNLLRERPASSLPLGRRYRAGRGRAQVRPIQRRHNAKLPSG